MAVPTPTFAAAVDQRFYLEEFSGPKHPRLYLDRFPDEVYNKAPESHLLRFMYALLGPAGIGWFRKEVLDARLKLEDNGFELFNLEGFYGNPFQFGRILSELYDDDPLGVLTREQWNAIKAKDESYRNRALDFFMGARLGTTAEGMRLASRSALGYDTAVIENFRYLFDIHSDNPLGLSYYGKTLSTEEFIILPKQEVSLTGDPVDETATIEDRERHHLQVALDRLRPVASIPTFNDGPGATSRVNYSTVFSSSAYTEVLRFVTGSSSVSWPSIDTNHWIVGGVEKEAPRIHDDRQHHYVGFHNIVSTISYTEAAVADPGYSTAVPTTESYNAGNFSPAQQAALPFLRAYNGKGITFIPDRAPADYPEPVTAGSRDSDTSTVFLNGIYPSDYADLPGVPPVRYKEEQFWASQERASGDEYLEIDLGTPQAVNFVALEVTRKPVDIEISFDLIDQYPSRTFIVATPVRGIAYPTSIDYEPINQNPWTYLAYSFTDARGQIPFTRVIRIKFSRRIPLLLPDATSNRFLYDPVTQTQLPWSIEAKNVRIGRNVSSV